MSTTRTSLSALSHATCYLRIHRLIILSLLGWFCSTAAAATMEEFAGCYVGHRIERWSYPTREVRHFDEITIYETDGSYWTRLQAADGAVYILTGYLSFNADGSWEANNGQHWRADFRGNTLTIFVDWRPFGIGAVVQSMTHRVNIIPIDTIPRVGPRAQRLNPAPSRLDRRPPNSVPSVLSASQLATGVQNRMPLNSYSQVVSGLSSQPPVRASDEGGSTPPPSPASTARP